MYIRRTQCLKEWLNLLFCELLSFCLISNQATHFVSFFSWSPGSLNKRTNEYCNGYQPLNLSETNLAVSHIDPLYLFFHFKCNLYSYNWISLIFKIFYWSTVDTQSVVVSSICQFTFLWINWSCLFLSVPTVVHFIISQLFHSTLVPVFHLARFTLHSILYTLH